MPNIYSPNEYNTNFIRAIHRFYEEPSFRGNSLEC